MSSRSDRRTLWLGLAGAWLSSVSARRRLVGTLVLALMAAVLLEPLLAAVRPVSAQTAITVTDVVGRTVTVNVPVQRMLLGEGRHLYAVAALETEDPFARIVGWAEDVRTSDLDTYEKYGQMFPKMYDIPMFAQVQSGGFSAEKALDLRPDVMLMSLDNYGPSRDSGLVDTLAKVGIPTVVIDYRQQQLETTVPSTVLLGRLLGREARAQQVVDYYLQEVNKVYSRVESIKDPQPSVFLFRVATLNECCGSFGRSTLGLLVERAGGVNIGAQRIPGHTGVLNPEFVLSSDPDIIVATGSNWTYSPTIKDSFVSLGLNADPVQARERLQGLTATPGFVGLKAVQNKRFHAIWHQFYGSPYHFAALQQLAKWQHPDKFADLDPDASLREFYTRFLPIPLTGAFWVSLAD